MHNLSSCFVLGFHGGDRGVARKLLMREERFRKSENTYDWLGHGTYFWIENPRRTCEWARRQAKLGKFEPAVVGAIINLGNCLDLTTTAGIEQIQAGYELLKEIYTRQGRSLPANECAHDGDNDRLIRRLDCAVINMTCEFLEHDGIRIDTVKGMFTEGGPAYDGAGFTEQTHTQVCVRNPKCILGVFLPPREMQGDDLASVCNDTPC